MASIKPMAVVGDCENEVSYSYRHDGVCLMKEVKALITAALLVSAAVILVIATVHGADAGPDTGVIEHRRELLRQVRALSGSPSPLATDCTLYASASGNDSSSGTSSLAPRTFQSAANAAQPGEES